MNFKGMFLAAIATSLIAIPAAAGVEDRLLSIVPSDAATVGMLRLDDVRRGPLGSRLFDDMNNAGSDGELGRFLEEAGLRPREDVDALVFASTPRGLTGEADFLVAALGRFDTARLAQALVSRGAEVRTAGGATYYIAPEEEGDSPAIWFAANDLTIAGTEDAIVRAMADVKKGGTNFLAASPLAHDLRRVDQLATGWLLVDVQRSARLGEGRPDVPENSTFDVAAIASSMKKVSTVAAWAREDSDDVIFGATAVSADQETIELLSDVLRGVTAAWRMAAQEKNPEMVSIIRGFKVETGSDSVILTGSIPSEFVRKATAHHASR